MKKRKLFRNRKLILMSLCICLPIIIVIVVLNYQVRGTVQQSIFLDNKINVESRIQVTDDQVTSIERESYNLSNVVSDNPVFKTKDWRKQYTDIMSISNQLCSLELNSNIVDKAFIFSRGKDPYLIDSRGTSTLTVKKYHTLISKSKNKQRDWCIYNDNLFFLQQLNVEGKSAPIIIIQVNIENLLNDFSTTIGKKNALILIGNDKVSDNIHDDFLLTYKKQTNSSISYQGKQYRIIKVQHTHLDKIWSYYVAISTDELFSPFVKVSRYLMIFCVLGLLLTFVFTRFFGEQLYKPVHQLIELSSPSEDEIEGKDEFDYLQEKWKELIHQQQRLLSDKEKADTRLKEKFLNQIAHGRYNYYSEEEIQNKAKELSFSIENSKKYFFLSIQLTDTIEENNQILQNESSSYGFILSNIVGELNNTICTSAVIVDTTDGSAVVFASFDDKDRLAYYFSLLSKNVNKILGRWINVTTSRRVDDWKDVNIIYKELVRKRDHQVYLLENQLIDIEEIQKNKDNFYPVINELESQILGVFDSNNEAKLKSLVREYAKTLSEIRPTRRFFIDAMRHLYLIIIKLLDDNGISRDSIPSENEFIETIHPIIHESKIADIILDSLIIPSIEILNDYRKDDLDRKIARVINYLKDNFDNPGISLEQTVEKFDVNIHTFRNKFKEKTGKTYMDYLTELRMTAAKQLLLMTNIHVNEIAKKVGYQPSYFNRVFKKIYGITPGEFRRNK